MVYPPGRSNCSIVATQNMQDSNSKEEAYRLELRQTVSKLCDEIFKKSSDSQVERNPGLAMVSNNYIQQIESRPLQAILGSNSFTVRQRVQALKLPLHQMIRWKKSLDEKNMVIYCPQYAHLLFDGKGNVIDYVKSSELKSKNQIFCPDVLPEEYRLSELFFKINCNHHNHYWMKNMNALSFIGMELFPYSYALFPLLHALFQRMIWLSPYKALSELENLEKSGHLYPV